jgi:hypothetical protein
MHRRERRGSTVERGMTVAGISPAVGCPRKSRRCGPRPSTATGSASPCTSCRGSGACRCGG